VRGRFAAGAIGRPALLMGIVTALLLIRRWHRYRVTSAVGSAMTVLPGVSADGLSAAADRKWWFVPARTRCRDNGAAHGGAAAGTTPPRGGALG
jgi:hypothetical protein